MITEQIKENLCYNDERNPNHWNIQILHADCPCDNCETGRTELADELLQVKEKLKIAQSLVSFK